jgi:glucose/arabinose dehydrogenase
MTILDLFCGNSKRRTLSHNRVNAAQARAGFFVFNVAILIATSLYTSVLWADTSRLIYQQQAIVIGGTSYDVLIPAGYKLELLTTELVKPRMLTFAANGDLIIGSKSGRVYRAAPPYDWPEILIELPDYPHSVALRKGEILIAQTHGLYRAPYQIGQESIAKKDIKLLAKLPGGRGHNSRTVMIGPDRRIYLSLGISANCSDQYLDSSYKFGNRRGGVLVLNEQTSPPHWEPYASGLRNPVGIDWQPKTGELYATNNGPDHWGYELPPENFRKLPANSFHGMPWYQYDGKTMRRDDCISSTPPEKVGEVNLPDAVFPSRNAPLGMAFVPTGGLDSRLEGDAIVALHGSWGTLPDGGFIGDKSTRREPKIVAVRFKLGKAVRVDELITGFQLKNGDRWARPAGVTVGHDGALYFTSDGGQNGLFRLRKIQ